MEPQPSEGVNSALTVFHFDAGKSQSLKVRTAGTPDNPVFVAVDVCTALEIQNARDAFARLDDDEKTTVVLTDGGQSNGLPLNAVTEAGLYSLIMGSRKASAKAFKRWVTHHVLPTIRKTGKYEVAPQRPLSRLEWMEEAMKSERRAVALESKVEELAPKAEFHDKVASAKNGQTWGEVAKILKTGPRLLRAALKEKLVLMSNGLPYQNQMNAGRFIVVERSFSRNSGEIENYSQVLVTGKGFIYIQKLLYPVPGQEELELL